MSSESYEEELLNFFPNKMNEFPDVVESEVIPLIRERVALAMEGIGYDTGKSLNKEIIDSIKIVFDVDGDTYTPRIDMDIGSRDIVTSWTNKDGSTHESSISVDDIIKNIDEGRKGYTIKGVNTEHKLIAIPPSGGKYDPNDPKNVRVKAAKIPSHPAANIFKVVEDTFDEWLPVYEARILSEFYGIFVNYLKTIQGG